MAINTKQHTTQFNQTVSVQHISPGGSISLPGSS